MPTDKPVLDAVADTAGNPLSEDEIDVIRLDGYEMLDQQPLEGYTYVIRSWGDGRIYHITDGRGKASRFNT